MQFRVGVLVAATILITLILIGLFGESPRFFQNLAHPQKTFNVRFPTAPNVEKDTPIRKSGILIGRVADVKLLDEGGVEVVAKIDSDRTIRRNEVCRITSANFLGEAMLEFVPSTDRTASDDPITDGAFMEGEVATDVFEAIRGFADLQGDIERTLGSIETAGTDVATVAQNLNTLVADNNGQVNRILSKTEQVLITTDRALARFDTAMSSVNDLISDEELRERIRRALDEVPQILADAGSLVVALQRVANQAEENLDNLQGLTKPLGDQGDQIVATVEESVEKLDVFLEQLVQFSKSINESEGSLSQFVNNPDLYQKLDRAATNIEKVTRRLEPIVDDARVAMDKVARNPGRLGVQGLLRNQQSGLK